MKLLRKLDVSFIFLDKSIILINYHFIVSKNQIVRLYSRFLSLDKQGRGFLDRDDLLRIPELAINPLGDRIVDAFFSGQGDGERMNFRHFINVLAHFRPINKRKPNAINSRESKLKCKFILTSFFHGITTGYF